MPNLALLDETSECTDTFFDRDIEVAAVQVIEVDHVGLQVCETLIAGLLDRGRGAINAALALVIDHDAALARQHELTAPLPEDPADELFVVAETVDARGVEERVPDLESMKQGAFRFYGVGFPVGLGHAHAPNANRRNFQTGEFSCLHVVSLVHALHRVQLNQTLEMTLSAKPFSRSLFCSRVWVSASLR